MTSLVNHTIKHFISIMIIIRLLKDADIHIHLCRSMDFVMAKVSFFSSY